MSRKIHEDLTGRKFGRWTVVEPVPPHLICGRNIRYWKCECGCDKHTIKEVGERELLTGKSQSCGCYKMERMHEAARRANTKHGMTNTRLYRIYKHMMNRCYNENDISYQKYGAKGITVCDEWSSFEPFRDWALSNGYTDNLTIDRIDSSCGYCPDNCRWTGYDEQNNNRSVVKIIEYNGEAHSISEWAKKLNMPYKKLWKRIHVGWDIEKALTT